MFLTLAFDDQYNVLVARYSEPSTSNSAPPATVECDGQNMLSVALEGGEFAYTAANTEDRRKLSFTHEEMHRRLAANPVAAAVVFIRMVNCTMTHLLGRSLEGEVKKSEAGSKGVFGPLFSGGGCIETQGRGTLHLHINLWGGLCPELMQSVAAYPVWAKHVAKTLDRMVRAGLPENLLVDQLLCDVKRDVPHNDRRRQNAFVVIPSPPTDLSDVEAVERWREEMEKLGHRVCANCQVSEGSTLPC